MRAFAAVIVWLASVVALGLLSLDIYEQQEELEARRVDAVVRIEAAAQQLDERLDEIGIRVPPTKDRIYDILTRGLTVTEVVLKTDSATATPEAAFAADLSTAQKTDAYVQQIIIRNASSDNGLTGETLCWTWTPWVGVDTCQTTCAAASATMTCSGASTDGAHIAPGAEVARRLDGTNCVCIIGTATNVEYQTQRSIR